MGQGTSCEKQPESQPKEPVAQAKMSGLKVKRCRTIQKLVNSPTRKAPPVNSKECKVGSISKGNDGEMWKNTAKGWKRMPKEMQAETQKLYRAMSPKRRKRKRKSKKN